LVSFFLSSLLIAESLKMANINQTISE